MSFATPMAEEDRPLSAREQWLPSARQFRLVTLWCAAYLLSTILTFLSDSLWLLLVSAILWIFALALAVNGLLYLRSARRAPGGVILTILLMPAAAYGMASSAGPLAAWAAFELSRDDFQAVVDVVSRSREPAHGGTTARGTTYLVEAGPPRRIAFVTHPGIADNWGAVVYDPSDAVASARAPSWTDAGASVPEEVRELFGGDIVSCRHLDDHFYRCGFT